MRTVSGVYRKGKLIVSLRGFGKHTVEYFIKKSPSYVLGGLIYFRFLGKKWEFFGNVRPSITRRDLMSNAKAYVQWKKP